MPSPTSRSLETETSNAQRHKRNRRERVMLRVLGRATSGNVQKVLFFLEETGTPYSREDYGRQFNNTGGDYLKLNPNGKVPTNDEDDLVVWESHTIVRYLASKHG